LTSKLTFYFVLRCTNLKTNALVCIMSEGENFHSLIIENVQYAYYCDDFHYPGFHCHHSHANCMNDPLRRVFHDRQVVVGHFLKPENANPRMFGLW